MIMASGGGIPPRPAKLYSNVDAQKGGNAFHQVCRGKSDSSRFGKQSRLSSDLKIREIMRTGRRFSGRYLRVRFLISDDTMRQFCIRVPKRIGNAVLRNRIKRLIREELRKGMDRFRPGVKAVIVLNEVPAGKIASELSDDLTRCLGNA